MACTSLPSLLSTTRVGTVTSEENGASAWLTAELPGRVRDACRPPQDPGARHELARFVPPLARMLLVTAGLREALDGRLHATPAQRRQPMSGSPQPVSAPPSTADAGAADLFGQIRASLQTPIVNTIWRSLATSGHLDAAWSALAPQVTASRPIADGLQEHALTVATQLPWARVASMEALAACGVDDAAPGMRAVLTTYLLTLPRVLTLAASSAEGGH